MEDDKQSQIIILAKSPNEDAARVREEKIAAAIAEQHENYKQNPLRSFVDDNDERGDNAGNQILYGIVNGNLGAIGAGLEDWSISEIAKGLDGVMVDEKAVRTPNNPLQGTLTDSSNFVNARPWGRAEIEDTLLELPSFKFGGAELEIGFGQHDIPINNGFNLRDGNALFGTVKLSIER